MYELKKKYFQASTCTYLNVCHLLIRFGRHVAREIGKFSLKMCCMKPRFSSANFIKKIHDILKRNRNKNPDDAQMSYWNIFHQQVRRGQATLRVNSIIFHNL